MTNIKKINPIENLWQTKDIRENNRSLKWRIPIAVFKSIGLITLDTAMLFVSWTIANRLVTPTVGVDLTALTIPILAVILGTFTSAGFYGTDDKLHRFPKLFKSLTLAQIVVLITAFFYQPGIWESRSFFLIAWSLNFLFISSARFLFDLAKIRLRQHYPIFQHPIVLVGDRADIDRIQKLLQRSQQFRVDSIIDLSVWDRQSQLDQILDRVRSRNITEVFICSQHALDNQVIWLWNLKAAGIHLRMVPTNLQLPEREAETKMIEEIPTIRFKSLSIFRIDFLLKCCLDKVFAALILLVLTPALLVIAILIKKTSAGPIFYQQDRVGLKGRRFKIWKFRTMVANANELQKELELQNEIKGGVLFKIKADPRITKVGKFLRDYSIDELPQLINVLQGQMSLVGPRPLAIRDYELSIQDIEQFSQDRFLRYEVLPGITGLWQVKGRTSTDSKEIFYWDMVYILQWSLTLDLKILLETIRVVLFKEGSC